MRLTFMLAQADPRALDALERIATAQVVMAVVMVVTGVVVLVAALLIFQQVRALRAMLHGSVDDLKPRLIPLIDRARSVTDDVAGMTDNVRRKVDDVLHTVEDLRRAVEKGGNATEERVRRFGAVLDVVQTEAEDLLLDAAATARGVHETARALKQPKRPRRLLRRRRTQREDEE